MTTEKMIIWALELYTGKEGWQIRKVDHHPSLLREWYESYKEDFPFVPCRIKAYVRHEHKPQRTTCYRIREDQLCFDM